MDLNELKALETKLETLEKEKQELIDNQKMVIVLHKYFTGTLISKFDNNRVILSGLRSPNNVSGMRLFEKEYSLDELFKANIIDVDLKEDTTRVSKDYINLSEVTEELRGVIGAEYEQRLSEARERATKTEYELTAIDDKHIKRIRVLNESYQGDMLKLRKGHDAEVKELDEKYNELEEAYTDLKNDKVKISLEQQVADLNSAINKLTHRTFWQRVFNHGS